jgi:hypothetical protein
VLACEFFATKDGPVFNEMAPRVHNSGHWTIEGSVTSQFENHIRAICGLPLGSTALVGQRVEMRNLIGADADAGRPFWPTVPTHLHLYGKSGQRPDRKMGTIAAFEGHGPLTILHIDAHVDWADVIKGNPHGYGSPMRRASEYPWVTSMVQVGMRGLGSGESWQHDDARNWGSRLVSSYELHERGPESALSHIEPGARVFISLDCDGIDPAVLPAVNMPTPGGLTYEDMIRLLRGVAAKASIAGLALVEYVPARDDRHQLSGLVASRIAAVTLGLALGAA